jgi:large subunit ribosomal protein L24
MAKAHVKKGDDVVVISGAERGKRGKVINVSASSGRLLVEGLNLIKRHVKKSAQQPEGAIIEREGSIHASNVIRAEVYDSRSAKRTPAGTQP